VIDSERPVQRGADETVAIHFETQSRQVTLSRSARCTTHLVFHQNRGFRVLLYFLRGGANDSALQIRNRLRVDWIFPARSYFHDREDFGRRID